MATRSKSIRFSIVFKLIALAVGLFGTLQLFTGLTQYRDFSYGIEADYLQSAMLTREVETIRDKLFLMVTLRSEEYIRSGLPISADDVEKEVDALRQERSQSTARLADRYARQIGEAAQRGNPEVKVQLEQERDAKQAALNDEFDAKQAMARDAVMMKKINQFYEAKSFIDNYEGMFYSIMDNNPATSKEPEAYAGLPYHGKIALDQDRIAYIAFTQPVFQRQAAAFAPRHENGANGMRQTAKGAGMMLVALLWLMYGAGRSPSLQDMKFGLFDRMYLDLGLLVIGGAAVAAGYAGVAIALEEQNKIAPIVVQGGQLAVAAAYLLTVFYAVLLAKRLHARCAFRHTLVFQLLLAVKTVVAGGPLLLKAALYYFLYLAAVVVGLTLLSGEESGIGAKLGGALLFLAANGLTLLIAWKRFAGFKALAEGIKRIKDGQMEGEIPACGSTGLDEVIDDLNNIADGLKNALEREFKAEHMKVELITNVSHDLKTPLTSIISYSDLLSRSGLSAEQMQRYVSIIQTKSIRLKHLVDDLFEISKAQSGTIALKLETLCLNELLRQAYAEYEDGFAATELSMVMTLPETKINVTADGTKLWRVMSNVLNNAIKYSLAGTRVYVDVERSAERAYVTVKNISSYPMNFNEEEIMERFKRGDESRTGEGSGLGLAIVKSFMELQNGSCELAVDGDLFKIRLGVPIAQTDNALLLTDDAAIAAETNRNQAKPLG